jgi:hypothetical protein
MSTDDAAVKATLHPAVASVLQFFEHSHLPPHLAAVSKPFCDLAWGLTALPQNSQLTLSLNHLLMAKDAAVRAVLHK